MIFVGPNLNDPNAHFVTNVIGSIGSENDLILDVLRIDERSDIFSSISAHLDIHDEEYIIYSAKEDEDFFLYVKEEFPQLKLIMFFSDDEWRHNNYDRYLALYSDYFTVAVKSNIEKYRRYGFCNVFYMRWGCNPHTFYPVPVNKKKYDVTFIGAAYGLRIEYVRFLISNNINVHLFGRGWEVYKDLSPNYGGCPSHGEMIDIIAQSKINLNFIWTSRNPEETTIKGRTLEIAACNAFQLSNYTSEFENYGFSDGENISVFHDMDSLLEKVKYYLQHEEERNCIAQLSYKHVTELLTWNQQFKELFSFTKTGASKSLPKFNVLVINRKKLLHKITADDSRLQIDFVDNEISNYEKYDGVINLNNNSTIDNNAIMMMVFGLFADATDVAIANFYIDSDVGKRWIRFDNRDSVSNFLRALLPDNAVMYSGRFYERKNKKTNDFASNITCVEYPVCIIEVGYIKSRLLRLNYGVCRDLRGRYKTHISNMNIIGLIGLIVDKLWQKVNIKYENKRHI